MDSLGDRPRYPGLSHGHDQFAEIVQCLRAEGKDGSTPVAVIRWGTRVSQRTVGARWMILWKAAAARMEPPTVIVVRRGWASGRRLNWFEHVRYLENGFSSRDRSRKPPNFPI